MTQMYRILQWGWETLGQWFLCGIALSIYCLNYVSLSDNAFATDQQVYTRQIPDYLRRHCRNCHQRSVGGVNSNLLIRKYRIIKVGGKTSSLFWENIAKDIKINFDQYSNSLIPQFEVGFDYGSVMHFSQRRFL